jgi:hypothetical protein
VQYVLSVFALLVLAAAAFLVANRPLVVPVQGSMPAGFPADGFSHDDFEALLRTYVSAQGDIDYDRWHGSADARAALDDYLTAVSRVSPESSPGRFTDRSGELAYWMYGYNAYVIKVVLDNWPIKSVTDVKAPIEAVKGLGFFHRQRFVFGGKAMSLLTVENKKIRSGFRDPRIHFVLSCASESCPVVRPDLPTGDALEAMLDEAAVEFIANPQNVFVNHEAQQVVLSRIFKWYKGDFVDFSRLHGNPASKDAVDYIRSVAPKSLALELKQAADYEVVYRDYDWAINAS